MKLQKRHCSIARAGLDCAWARSIGDAEQEIDHQIAPQQPGELLGEICWAASDQSGGARLAHDLPQRGATCLTPYRIERPRHLWRLYRLRDRQPEDRHHVGVADFPHGLGPECRNTCTSVARSRSIGMLAGAWSRLARSPMAVISICCLLPTSA